MHLINTISKYTLLTTAALTLSSLLFCAPAVSADTPFPPEQTETLKAQRGISLNDAESGSLMLKTDIAGRYIAAPMVATDVNMKIAGPIIRTTVSQTFKNTSADWVEGVYVFPLPENAAVDRLRMVIGTRLIEGEIHEKKQAKAIYEQAKAQGKKASLVEQQRPNMFTASVANIGPGESVSIQIEYQDKASIKSGLFSMRFPMTVGPRYSPPAQIIEVATQNGQQFAVLDPVLDRRAISPPIMNPKDEPIEYLRLPVTMNITLDAGFDIDAITSAYHEVIVNEVDEGSATITLSEGEIPANRDFLLEWSAQENDAPYSANFTQTIGEDTYLLSMLTPPKSEREAVEGQPRESIYIIDTSGSMGGTSIEQARQSLRLALDKLQPHDTFNIIRFASDYSTFTAKPIKASQDNINRAHRWVSRLQADGGTQISPALNEAFRKQGQPKGRIRQVIFITDGSIGNEAQLFAQIKDDLGDARLFPVAIGSAPNSFFMSRAAKFGRGTYVNIGDISEVATRMGDLFSAIDNPILTDLTFNIKGEAYPRRLPDIYEGEPVISIAKIKTKNLPKTLNFSGTIESSNWTDSQTLSNAQPATGLSVLWARAKIAELEESRFNRSGANKIDADILKTALEHHIVTRLTSLVAVDVTPSWPIGKTLESAPVPTMLPEGWDFAKLAHDSNSTPRALMRPAPPTPSTPASRTVPLPGTASPHQILALLGALMMVLGLGLSKFRRPTYF